MHAWQEVTFQHVRTPQTADQFGPALVEQLDFINCHVPPKPCVPEPRVFVGEVSREWGCVCGGNRPDQGGAAATPALHERRPSTLSEPHLHPPTSTTAPQFGYFLRNNNCTPHLAPPVKSTSGGAMRDSTPEIVKARTLWHVANALAWGAPMALHWQL